MVGYIGEGSLGLLRIDFLTGIQKKVLQIKKRCDGKQWVILLSGSEIWREECEWLISFVSHGLSDRKFGRSRNGNRR